MENDKLTKIVFFTGYNYHLRYYNIQRKIKNLNANAERFQKAVTDNFKPLTFAGGEVKKDGKKLAEIKGFKIDIKSNIKNLTSRLKKVSTIPYTEECKYYLMVEIISETTQYCADLASIIIGLKDFKTNRSTYSQIADAKLKKWYQTLQEPSLRDFLEIFNLNPLNEIPLEERFMVGLKYDQFLWNLNKIGKFYGYNYDYLYTPFRHGMKGSFWKDSENRVFCRTLTRDKKFNLFYLSDNRINECQEIAEIIFTIFHTDLGPILFKKVLPSSFTKHQITALKAPQLPKISFNPENLKKKFESLRGIKIHHFFSGDVASINDFSRNHENNIKYNFIKMKKGTSYCKIDGVNYYLDEFFSFSKKINKSDYIVIVNSPLAYYIELAIINNRTGELYDLMMGEFREFIFQYLAMEKDFDYVFEDPLKIVQRKNQILVRTEEILNDFIGLIGLYNNHKIYETLQFSEGELDFLIYVQKKNMIRLFNMKNYMKKLYPDIILQIVLQLLLINYFKPNQIKTYLKELHVKDIKLFLKTSDSYLSNSAKNQLNFDKLLAFLNFLFDTINDLGKDI